MRDFYRDILNRQLSGRKWDNTGLEPLEAVVYRECISDAEALRVHNHKFRLMLNDIAKREWEEANYGEGAHDLVLSIFRTSLGLTEITIPPEEANTPRGICLAHRAKTVARNALIYKEEVDVYSLRRQGLSTGETATKLGICEKDVTEAEKNLIRLYIIANREGGESPPVSLRSPRFQTRLALDSGAFRVFRRDVTGAVQYRFYCRDRQIGSGSALIGRDFPMVLQCNGLILNSSFDPDQTVVRGVSRRIVDSDNATAEVARITYLGEDGHELRLNWDTGVVSFRIQSADNIHRFYQEDRLVAEIVPLQLPQHMGDWEITYCLRPHEDLSDETAMLMLSFPLLRFAL